MFTTIRSLLRLISIARVLASHGALFLFDKIAVARFAVVFAKISSRKKYVGKTRGQRLAEALTELGPTFIKLGQSLSTRPDLLGVDIAQDLTELRDKVPEFDGKTAISIIENDLGKPIDKLFSSFDEKPVAAASIAQVHFAITTDGKQVAVKVLRPNIENMLKRDIRLFYWLAKTTEKLQPSLKRLKPVQMVKTFEHTISLEMDLRYEGAAAEEFTDNFYGDDDLKIPEIDWIRTGQRVLTMERIKGVPIDDAKELKKQGHDLTKITTKSAETFFNMVFKDGFFHGDLHPGNLFVGKNGEIIALDFGITGRLSEETRYYLAEILYGFTNGDFKRVAKVHFQAGFVSKEHNIDEFAQACRSITAPIINRPLNEISIAKVLGQLFQITKTYGMETQPQLLLLQKSMLTAEGIGRILTPGFNMWELARPLVEEWVYNNIGPEAQIKRRFKKTVKMADNLPTLVNNASNVVEDLRVGGIKIHPDTVRTMIEENTKRVRCERKPFRLGIIIPWAIVLFLLYKYLSL